MFLSRVGIFSTDLPSTRISPLDTVSNPEMQRSSVDFPQPDGPTRTTNSPSSTSRSICSRMLTFPKDLQTDLIDREEMFAS